MITARTDVVGSLLRPRELLQARQRLERGEIGPPEFKWVEDAAVEAGIRLQEDAGLAVITDGEMRRLSFQSQLTEAVEGFSDWDLDAFLRGDWHGDEVGNKRIKRPPIAVLSQLRCRRFLSAEEFTYARGRTKRILKVTLPSPSLLAQPRQARQAGGPPGVAYHAADRQRLLRRHPQRHHVPSRDPATTVFRPKADDAVNYSGIGSVIGHEISHAFDDQGRKFDGTGNLRDLWTPQDLQRFTARTTAVAAQYSAYQPLPGEHINGELTLGENIADLSGLTVAMRAYHLSLGARPAPMMDGFTGTQRFFLGFAQVWRGKYRDEELRADLLSDPHSPAEFRTKRRRQKPTRVLHGLRRQARRQTVPPTRRPRQNLGEPASHPHHRNTSSGLGGGERAANHRDRELLGLPAADRELFHSRADRLFASEMAE